MSGRINALLVVGGKFHDFDYARLKLLELLAKDDRIRTQVDTNFEDLDALENSDLLIAYTCDIRPSVAAQDAMKKWVEAGGRFFALHATNSAFDAPATFGAGDFQTPNVFPTFVEVLGSQFLSHPPIEPYPVYITPGKEDDPLVKGIPPFSANDELYLCHFVADVEPLLETRWTGTTQGFATANWLLDEPRLVMYRRPLGKGCVLYFTLGHCRSHWDMKDPPFNGMRWPTIDRGSWELDEYNIILERGLYWACEPAIDRITKNPAPELKR
jgi:type 1 glutamine amidotransferase